VRGRAPGPGRRSGYFVVVALLFLDLFTDRTQLLVQHHLPLALLDALRHLLGDLLLDGQHGVLLGQQLEQRKQALFHRGDLQQALLLTHTHQELGGDRCRPVRPRRRPAPAPAAPRRASGGSVGR